MNYEEYLNAQDGVATHREELPLGVFYKKLIDKKYRNVLELKTELVDDIVFCEALKAEQEKVAQITAPQQLHYELHVDSGGVYEIEIEQGNFQTFAQLIDNNPAVVAQPGFIDNTVSSLLKFTTMLNEQGIYHLCFAPQNVFVRKGDNMAMLLCHASSFGAMTHTDALFKGFEDFVAPEVLSHEALDERGEVYSIGKFIEWLYQHGEMPYEYKKVVARATQQDAAKRYGSAADMLSALQKKRGLKQSTLMLVAALVVALLCVGLYFELMPQTANIEFVEGAKQESTDDLLDDGINPVTEMGVWGDMDEEGDTLNSEERLQMEAYQSKAEDIFRKQFAKEADRIFSKMYSKDRMSLSEDTYIQSNNQLANELLKLQGDLATQAGISDEKAQTIASEIIDKLREEKQKSVVRYGVQKGGSQEEE
ncbi:MAG: hypothetical protein IJ612_05610 [Prevotella sp.]|nr:hypothetical protein [Prevotella sp.]